MEFVNKFENICTFLLLKCCFIALTRLQVFKQKGACLLITLGLLKTVKKHLLVLDTLSWSLWWSRHLCWSYRCRLGTTASSAHTTNDCTNSLMGNGGTCSKGHSLHNGRSNARHHSTTTAGGGWCRSCRTRSWSWCGCRTTCWCSWGGTTSRSATGTLWKGEHCKRWVHDSESVDMWNYSSLYRQLRKTCVWNRIGSHHCRSSIPLFVSGLLSRKTFLNCENTTHEQNASLWDYLQPWWERRNE